MQLHKNVNKQQTISMSATLSCDMIVPNLGSSVMVEHAQVQDPITDAQMLNLRTANALSTGYYPLELDSTVAVSGGTMTGYNAVSFPVVVPYTFGGVCAVAFRDLSGTMPSSAGYLTITTDLPAQYVPPYDLCEPIIYQSGTDTVVGRITYTSETGWNIYAGMVTNNFDALAVITMGDITVRWIEQ